MEILVESISGLERRMTVKVPAERIENEVEGRLHDLAGSIRLKGLQAGEVPFEVVKGKYHSQVRQEVVNDVIQSTLQTALVQEFLRPIGEPVIVHQETRPGEVLEYSATFEVYPDIELKSLAGMTIEKPVAQVEDEDVRNIMNKLRAQQATWRVVDRAAEMGDQVVIDFEGTVEGKPFSGSKGTAATVVLGSGTMIEGFERQLIGAQGGEHRTLNLKFPDDYFNKEVAGKDVNYAVDVRSVSESCLPALNDDFAKSLGVEGGLQALGDSIRSSMENELEQAIHTIIKTQILKILVDAHHVEAPKTMVNAEIANIKQTMRESAEAGASDIELPDALFEDQARKNVVAGLLVHEVINSNFIQTDHERVQRNLEKMAESYEAPDQLIQAYQSDPAKMKKLEWLVMEDQAVENLLGQMVVNTIPRKFDEVVRAAISAIKKIE